MNSDTLKGQWKQLAGAAKERWAKLTEDDWLQVEGNLQGLSGRIQERYGIARDKAEEQIQALMDRVKTADQGPRSGH
ncbi:CsbD family protein [Panacagrimonas sp.]|uniref:CsbD family protein n=1 Tax=Panacagrimonas sp. TaxID=2480088 RepID=UPI003B52A53F